MPDASCMLIAAPAPLSSVSTRRHGRALLKGSIATEVIPVTAVPHPFRTANEQRLVREGLTLQGILEEVQPDPILRQYAVIQIEGTPIPRENWGRVRPKAGKRVEVRVVPRGPACSGPAADASADRRALEGAR